MPLALGALRLEVTTDYRAFFRADDPRLAAFTGFQETYGKNDSVLFVLIPKAGDVFSAAAQQGIHDLTEGAWMIPHARRVDSLTNLPYSRAEADDLVVADLVPDPRALDAAGRAAVRATALGSAHPDPEEVHLTGISIMDEALGRIPMADMMRLMPLVFAVIFVAMTWLLRQWRLVAATFAVMLLAIGAAMGLAGRYGVLLTPPRRWRRSSS